MAVARDPLFTVVWRKCIYQFDMNNIYNSVISTTIDMNGTKRIREGRTLNWYPFSLLGRHSELSNVEPEIQCIFLFHVLLQSK